MKSEVYVTKFDGSPKNTISELLITANLNLPTNPKLICIKPNLCDYRFWESGATTDPNILDPLLATLSEKYPDSRLVLVENDATAVSADNIFHYLGISLVADKYDCEILNVARDEWISRPIKGIYFQNLLIPKIIAKCELFITHPKLKTCSATKISCSLKNQFAFHRRKRKISLHRILDAAIVDINLALQPKSILSIVDANICHEGIGGPSFGFPKKLGLLIAGNDIVAVDALCAKIAGFNPFFIGHIRKAARKKLGRIKYHLNTKLPKSEIFRGLKFERWIYFGLKLARGRF